MMSSTGSDKRPLTFTAAGLTSCEVRDQAGALACAPDQDVHLPPGQAQRVRGVIGGLMSDEIKCRERPHDIQSLSRLLPGSLRQCQDPLLSYALSFCCHARTSLLCIGVFSIVDDGEDRY